MVSMVTGLASLTSRTSMGILVVGGVVGLRLRVATPFHESIPVLSGFIAGDFFSNFKSLNIP